MNAQRYMDVGSDCAAAKAKTTPKKTALHLWYRKGPEFVWPWDQLNNKAISNAPLVQAESESESDSDVNYESVSKSDSDPSQQYLTSEEVDRVVEGCMSTIRTAITNKTPTDNSAKKDFFTRLNNGLQSKLLEELWGVQERDAAKGHEATKPTDHQLPDSIQSTSNDAKTFILHEPPIRSGRCFFVPDDVALMIPSALGYGT
ncbi:hypothetical protein N0V85_002407 [Neurospora sp. IMI 360204]|nr:hypothetical protein N0V85_002407 [Neurospora sp. IMI 360204]